MSQLLPTLNVARPLAVWTGVAAIYLVIVELITELTAITNWDLGDECATVLGFALGVLIVYRTNTANDRWWEGRKLWGQLVNDTRNFAFKARAHVDVGADEIGQLDRLLIAFPDALRLHLRGVDDIRLVTGFEHDDTNVSHPPAHIAGLAHQLLNRWNREGKLVDTIWILDIHARALLDICGGCERIRSTPIASSYRAVIRCSLLLYVLFAPWAIRLDAGWLGLPILMMALAFAFAMELIADAIEEPFGLDGDDLRLDGICEGIEVFIRELDDGDK